MIVKLCVKKHNT